MSSMGAGSLLTDQSECILGFLQLVWLRSCRRQRSQRLQKLHHFLKNSHALEILLI